jgi:hypothetical protein
MSPKHPNIRIEQFQPGQLVMLDLDRPTLVLEAPFMKPWKVAGSIEIVYWWVRILDGEDEKVVEIERLTHIK